MRGKFGVAVLLMATAAWLVAENSAEAGRRHHRRGGCGGGYSGCGYSGGCNTGCDTGCNTGCGSAPCDSGYNNAVPAEEAAPAAPAAPPAPTPDAGANAPAEKATTVSAAPQRTYTYYNTGRARRWSRR